MQLPMISFKLVAISVLGTQFITQAIAIPVNTQHSNAIEARGLGHELLDTTKAHFFPAEAEFKKNKQAEKDAEKAAKEAEKGATDESGKKAVEPGNGGAGDKFEKPEEDDD